MYKEYYRVRVVVVMQNNSRRLLVVCAAYKFYSEGMYIAAVCMYEAVLEHSAERGFEQEERSSRDLHAASGDESRAKSGQSFMSTRRRQWVVEQGSKSATPSYTLPENKRFLYLEEKNLDDFLKFK